MADNYLEKRYDEVFGKKTVTKRVGHTLDELLTRNRSTRGYNKSYVVSRNELQQIVAVNTKLGSGCNRQMLRFRLVTQGEEADKVLSNIKMGAALPELQRPGGGADDCRPGGRAVLRNHRAGLRQNRPMHRESPAQLYQPQRLMLALQSPAFIANICAQETSHA